VLNRMTQSKSIYRLVLTGSWYGNKGKKRPAAALEVIEIESNPYDGPTAKSPQRRSPKFCPPSPPQTDAPVPSTSSASDATYEEAIAYAMSAQYAAGYWLGVAHTKAASTQVASPQTHPTPHSAPATSNILHTRYEHLKR
jgi:hypothetical protein